MTQTARHIKRWICRHAEMLQRMAVVVLCCVMLYPTEVMAAVENTQRMDALLESQQQPEELASEEGGVSQESLPVSEQEPESAEENSSEENAEPMVSPNPSGSAAGANLYDRQPFVIDESDNYDAENDSVLVVVTADDAPAEFNGKRVFNPDPTRAVWMSVLCPGLGQIYNRRYWKLPIVVGGFVGLGYATAWNNNQLRDYTQGYRDLTDSDPATDSYMNFFPPNAQESDFDRTWLANTLKSRKDYYRRNRDLCIIGLVAVYLLCVVDAYVDASMAHFDISDNLSVDLQPAMISTPGDNKMSVGLNWAFNF